MFLNKDLACMVFSVAPIFWDRTKIFPYANILVNLYIYKVLIYFWVDQFRKFGHTLWINGWWRKKYRTSILKFEYSKFHIAGLRLKWFWLNYVNLGWFQYWYLYIRLGLLKYGFQQMCPSKLILPVLFRISECQTPNYHWKDFQNQNWLELFVQKVIDSANFIKRGGNSTANCSSSSCWS